MPMILVDTEQAALIEAAIAMLEAALTARVDRADPEKIISQSLALQAGKLATVRALLQAGDPPEFDQMEESTRSMAYRLMAEIAESAQPKGARRAWRELRVLVNAPALPASQ